MTIEAAGTTSIPAPTQRSGWGLFPVSANGKGHDLRSVIHYFFVEFNPFYCISALCVLYGVFLIARNIDALDASLGGLGQIALFAIMQLYECLIIASVAFLVHYARAIRPAVLLCLLEAVLIFDCTFRMEGIALLGMSGAFVTVTWLVLTGLKVWALGRALCIRFSPMHYASILATGGGIVGFIALSSQPNMNKPLVLQVAAWLGAFVVLALDAKRPLLSTDLATTEQQRKLFNLIAKAAFRVLAGFYFYHIWAFILLAAEPAVAGVAILPQVGAFFLLLALLHNRQSEIWCFGLIAVAAALPVPLAIPYALFLVGAVFAYRVWTGAHSNLAVGAVFSMYAGLWLYGWQGWSHSLPGLPALLSWETAALAVVLCLIGLLLRNFLAWIVLCTSLLYGAYTSLSRVLPTSELGRGVWIVCVGFVVLGVGIAVNWWGRTSPGSASAKEDGSQTAD